MQAAAGIQASGRLRDVGEVLRIALTALSLTLLAAGAAFSDPDLVLAAAFALYLGNLIHALTDVRRRFIQVFLYLGLFLFVFSRPLIVFFDPAMNNAELSTGPVTFIAYALYLSLGALFIADLVWDQLEAHNRWFQREHRPLHRLRLVTGAPASGRRRRPLAAVRSGLRRLVPGASERIDVLRRACLVLFIVCFLGACVYGLLEWRHMRGMTYLQFYLTESSDFAPSYIEVLYAMTPYMLAGYLTCLPRKRPATICLALYVLTTIPTLLIGSRSDFVAAAVFCLLYYGLRTALRKETGDPERWFTPGLVIFILIILPLGLAVMGFWSYLRLNQVMQTTNIFKTIEQALYSQGVTYTIMGYAYNVNGQVSLLGFKFYTIGDLFTTIREGFVGQQLLHMQSLGTANSVALAVEGNSYAHAMSFFAHGGYLDGEGYGSSYILELFADFGYGGVFGGSLVLGLVFNALSRAIGKSWFWGLIGLLAGMHAFHMPRGYWFEWISYIYSTRFILAMVLVVAVAALLWRFFTAKEVQVAPAPSIREPKRVSLVPGAASVLGARALADAPARHEGPLIVVDSSVRLVQ